MDRRTFFKKTAAAGVLAFTHPEEALAALARSTDKPESRESSPERYDFYQKLRIRQVRDAAGKMHPTICLTFDDGPSSHTTEVLDILESVGARATFFPIGAGAANHRDLLRTIAESGHELGNHTMHHKELPQLLEKEGFEEIWRTEIEPLSRLIEEASGRRPTSFRFPSMKGQGLSKSIFGKQMDIIGAGAYNGDWKKNAGTVDMLRSSIQQQGAGAIVLLHEADPKTRAMLEPELIRLKDAGYVFVTARQGIGRDPLLEDYRAV